MGERAISGPGHSSARPRAQTLVPTSMIAAVTSVPASCGTGRDNPCVCWTRASDCSVNGIKLKKKKKNPS